MYEAEKKIEIPEYNLESNNLFKESEIVAPRTTISDHKLSIYSSLEKSIRDSTLKRASYA